MTKIDARFAAPLAVEIEIKQRKRGTLPARPTRMARSWDGQPKKPALRASAALLMMALLTLFAPIAFLGCSKEAPEPATPTATNPPASPPPASPAVPENTNAAPGTNASTGHN